MKGAVREKKALETQMILGALARRHEQPRNGNSRAWVYAEEVRVAPGWSHHQRDDQTTDAVRLAAEQRLDAFALHTWPSEKWRRVAYEVKVSTADLRRELAQPDKCAAALALSNEFYLVAPTDVLIGGIIDDFPEVWGVMSFNKGRTTTIKRAPWRDTPLPPYSFMLSLARNLQAAAERMETD